MEARKFLSKITDSSEYAYNALEEIVLSSESIEEAEANIQSLIDGLRKASDKIQLLNRSPETPLTFKYIK